MNCKNIVDLTPGERIKLMRSQLNLTQLDLGEKVGLAQSTIGLIEKGTRKLTDRVLSDICRTCNINKNWILHGTGDMQQLTAPDTLEQLRQEFSLSAFDFNLVYEYLKLDSESRAVIRDFVNKIASSPVSDTFCVDLPSNSQQLEQKYLEHDNSEAI